MTRTLFVVSANLPDGLPTGVGDPDADGPKKDYTAIGRRLDADVLDWTRARRTPLHRLLAKAIGVSAVQALQAFLRRRRYDVILTDGEHIGIPVALLLKLTRARVGHVTIGHRLTASKKRPFFQWLRVQTHMHAVVLHSRHQYGLAKDTLGFSEEQLALLPYQVDPEFWHPIPAAEERLLVSAGLEFRDYPTLFAAVKDLDVQLKVGAASHWSKRKNTALTAGRPANVEVNSYNYWELRDLYSRAAVVVVPVDDVDFQAGITTVLEAMAMGKAVVVTHTYGQTDVIEDRRTATRNTTGAEERTRPVSLLRNVAAEEDVPIEQNGFYVPPKDAEALQRAIVYLLEHPERRAELGAAGRRAVERLMTVDQFAERIARVVAIVDAQAHGRPIPAVVGRAAASMSESRT
jgi:glycosyltransferase involved in cell wall biosynthesis